MLKKILAWLFIILWCVMIFYQSHKPAVASSAESMWIVVFVNERVSDVIGSGKLEISESFVRKTAHILEYLVLGGLLFNGYYFRYKASRTAGLSALTGVLYSVSDEIHQYFVPGRAMRVLDIGFDTAGLLLGIWISYRIAKRKAVRATE